VALAAHLVTVIHIDLGSPFGNKVVSLISLVAGETVERLVFSAMVKAYIPMGDFGSPGDGDCLVIVTSAAPVALYPGLSRVRPETHPLVLGSNQHGIYRQYRFQFQIGLVENRSTRLLIQFDNAALPGTNGHGQQNHYQGQQGLAGVFAIGGYSHSVSRGLGCRSSLEGLCL